MARNSKLNNKIQEEICQYLKIGHFMSTAAPLAGVSVRTSQTWLRRGREEEGRREMGDPADKKETKYLNFLHATEAATGHIANVAIRTVLKDIEHDRKAAIWFLTHRFPGSWSGHNDMLAMHEDLKARFEEDQLKREGKL